MKKLLSLLGLSLVGFSAALAAPPASVYEMGETIDPSCAQGSVNCTTRTPAASGDNSDIITMDALTRVNVNPVVDNIWGADPYTPDLASYAHNNTDAFHPSIMGRTRVDQNTAGSPAIGVYGEANHIGTFNFNELRGGDFEALHSGTGTLTDANGLITYVEGDGGTITNAAGVKVYGNFVGGGGTITNNYGILIESQDGVGSATNYGLYYDGPSPVVFTGEGNVGIGTFSPNEKLVIAGDGDADFDLYTASAGADNSTIHFNYSRGSLAAPAVAQNGDDIAAIDANYYDGDAFDSAANIEFFVDGTPGVNDLPGGIRFNTTPDGSDTLQTAMTIRQYGSVGIGTTAPDASLEVDTDETNFPDGWGSQLKLTGFQYPSLWFHSEDNNEGWLVGNNNGADLSFMTTDGTSAGEYLFEFEDSGQMFINADYATIFDEELHIAPSDGGTSSDTAIAMENNGHIYEIHVEDDDTFIIYENNIEDHTESIFEYDGTNNHIGFSGAEAVPGVFWNVDNGATLSNGGTWTDASSRALKQDIKRLSTSAAYGILSGLDPVSYAYIAEPDDQRLGFIAEDVPDEVATPSRTGLAPMDIVAVLTKVIQDQEERLQDQDERIKALEALLK